MANRHSNRYSIARPYSDYQQCAFLGNHNGTDHFPLLHVAVDKTTAILQYDNMRGKSANPNLAELDHWRLDGVIIGKALYEGRIQIEEAMANAR